MDGLIWWENRLVRALQGTLRRPILDCAEGSSIWSSRSPDFNEVNNILEKYPESITVIETDAAKTRHWSYVNTSGQNQVVSGTWPDEMRDQDSNTKECWTAAKAIEDLAAAGQLRGRILIKTDNNTCRSMINKRTGTSRLIRECAQKIDEAELNAHEEPFLVLATHIRGKNNIIADRGSREDNFEHDWNRDPLRDAQLAPKLFLNINDRYQKRTGSHLEIDMFSDNWGWNSHCGRNYRCPERTAFEFHQDTTNWHCYSFPPPAIAFDWLKRMIEENIKGVCIISTNPAMWQKSRTKWMNHNFETFAVFQSNHRALRWWNEGIQKWAAMKTDYDLRVLIPKHQKSNDEKRTVSRKRKK